jgi:hypothetical protein
LFTELFLDLNKHTDHKYNEFVLKQFFVSDKADIRAKYPVSVFGKGDIRQIADPNTITQFHK